MAVRDQKLFHLYFILNRVKWWTIIMEKRGMYLLRYG